MPTIFDRPKNPQAIKLTENDIKIMRAFYDYGPLSIEHLCLEIEKSSHVYVRRRCKLLMDNGYLIKPPIQEEVYQYRTGENSRPLIHQLGQRGAVYLRDRYGVTLNTANWDDKAKARSGVRGQSTFEHDVEANGVLIALKKAYRGREGFEVLTPSDIVESSPLATQQMKSDVFAMPTSYFWPADGKIYKRKVKPDGVFAYRVLGDSPQVWLVFLEYDQDTMPITRSSGDRTSTQQKIAMYNGLWNETKGVNLPRQRFGIDRFQVMFVTSGSNVHMSNMVTASKEYHLQTRRKVPRGKYFFTTKEQFERASNPLEKIWWHSDGGVRGFGV